MSPLPGVSFKGRILLANLLQSSRSTFSRGNFPSCFAFQEGMWDTPMSALGGSPTVSGRFRRHLTTYCEARCNSLTLNISPFLPESGGGCFTGVDRMCNRSGFRPHLSYGIHTCETPSLLPSQGDFCAPALLVYLDPMAVGLSDVEPSLPIQLY